MSFDRSSPSTVPTGLRERKRQETRQRLVEAGMQLFLANGYNATTLSMIADEAGIARRTFFSYFSSKEEILVAWNQSSWEPMLSDLRALSRDEQPLPALRRIFLTHLAAIHNDQLVAIERLLLMSETLRTRQQITFMEWEHAVYEAFIHVWPETEHRARLRMVAMMGVGAIRLAIETWQASGRHIHLQQLVDDSFSLLAHNASS